MSVQFGRWNSDGRPVDSSYLAKVKPVIAPYSPDDESAYMTSSLSILYRPFHTTKESRREAQPHVSKSGVVVTWDGRLDNRAELMLGLRDVVANDETDVAIVAAAFDNWGIRCFANLIGDWSLSIWDAKSRSLILAKDPIGSRHLFYSIEKDQVTWSTILDPLVLFADKSFALCEEYIAGWFSLFPATHLTPYVGIHSVPPCSWVLIRDGKRTVTKYWDFDPNKRIRYKTDAEYEEHFRTVFAEAVRRRLRSDTPILAELSGGMDSSSIVCMADTIVARGAAETPRLDTLSCYDDSEPNWNERPYFTRIEEKRGRSGYHINVGMQHALNFDFADDHFMASPGSTPGPASEANRQIAACMIAGGNRVVLSGIGGDEVMGGVPTPTPELEDLLRTGHFRTLAHQLKVWALQKRKPWFHLLLEAASRFFPPALVRAPKHKKPAAWLNPGFAKRNRRALHAYENKIKLLGPLPTFQESESTLHVLQRQLACANQSAEPPHEKSYPYLDRGLLEFIYSIPREQLVRPGQRRSLMRRALVGIVPDEVLNRKRKALVARAPLAAISAQCTHFTDMTQQMVCSLLGIVEAETFLKILKMARHGQEIPTVTVLRTLNIEGWLRNLQHCRIPICIEGHAEDLRKGSAPSPFSAEEN